jgi:hypothetical protein
VIGNGSDLGEVNGGCTDAYGDSNSEALSPPA